MEPFRVLIDRWADSFEFHEFGSEEKHKMLEIFNQVLIINGEKRRLELVRALATNPKLLLLDEPAAGQSSFDRETLLLHLQEISRRIPILFIEHDMNFIRSLADRVVAMHQGAVISEGFPDVVLSCPAVIDSYLGGVPC